MSCALAHRLTRLEQQARARLPLPEAPASANCHITLAGRQVQVTLRDTDETRLLARLQGLLSRYPLGEAAAPCPATPAPARQVAPPPEPTTASTLPAQVAEPTPEGWCVVHGLQMKLNNNERGRWYSHKVGETWCKGK